MKTFTKGIYIVNHLGAVYDMTNNEMIYKSSFADAVEFVKNITA